MAKFCLGLGWYIDVSIIRTRSDILQNLKRIEVITDDESEIIEAVKTINNNYDFVVKSRGIGPTYIY
jgi:hypothetical protein